MFFICGSASPVEMYRLWNCLISRTFSPVTPTHPQKWFTCGSSLLLGECLTRTSVPAEKFLTCGSPSPAQLSHLCSCLDCTTLTCGGPSPAQLSHLRRSLTCTTVSPVEVPHLHNCLTCGSPSPAQLSHLWKFLTCTTASPVEVPHWHNCLTCTCLTRESSSLSWECLTCTQLSCRSSSPVAVPHSSRCSHGGGRCF